MAVYFFEVEPWEERYLKKEFPKAKFYSSKLTSRKLKDCQNAEVISTFIYSKINAQKLEKLPKLKLIATRSTGFDHIDIEACQKKGVKVSNVPTYGENTVAEHAFALILALSRKIVPSVERTRMGDFNLSGLRGFDLKGKTIGVLGTGNIGAHIVRIAYGFEMKILAYDLQPKSELVKKYGISYTSSLKELFRRSDIITLHLPLNKHTYHLVNKEILAETKKGAYLINTARGGLIDSEALVWALEENILAGAGLDVLEEEPLIREERELLHKNIELSAMRDVLADQILLRHPKVIVTPHNAFNSREALERILKTTIKNIRAFLKGRAINVVSK